MVKYEVLCVNPITKKVRVIKTVESKQDAINFIAENRDICPEGKLTFRRAGYPIVGV